MRPPSYYTSLASNNYSSGSSPARQNTSSQLRSSFLSPSSSNYVSRTHLPYVAHSTLVAHCFTGPSSTRPYGSSGSDYQSSTGRSNYSGSNNSSLTRAPSYYATPTSKSNQGYATTTTGSRSLANRSTSSINRRLTGASSTLSPSSVSTTSSSSSYTSSRPSYLSPSSTISATSRSSYRPNAGSYYKPIRLRERPLLSQLTRQITGSSSSSVTTSGGAGSRRPSSSHLSPPTFVSHSTQRQHQLSTNNTNTNTNTNNNNNTTTDQTVANGKPAAVGSSEEPSGHVHEASINDDDDESWSRDVARNISRNKYLIKFREFDKHRPTLAEIDVNLGNDSKAIESCANNNLGCDISKASELIGSEILVPEAAADKQQTNLSSKIIEKTREPTSAKIDDAPDGNDPTITTIKTIKKKKKDKKPAIIKSVDQAAARSCEDDLKVKVTNENLPEVVASAPTTDVVLTKVDEEAKLRVDPPVNDDKAPVKRRNVKLKLKVAPRKAKLISEPEKSEVEQAKSAVESEKVAPEVRSLDRTQQPAVKPEPNNMQTKKPEAVKHNDQKLINRDITTKRQSIDDEQQNRLQDDEQPTSKESTKVKVKKKKKKETEKSGSLIQKAAQKNAELAPKKASGTASSLGTGSVGVTEANAQKRIKFREYQHDDFNFLTVLGHGGWGFVVLAELKDHDVCFAVKCIKKITIVEDDDFDSILIERKVLALGNINPFICKLFCTFETPGYLFFVMEFCPGGDLMFHVQREGKFTESRCRFYAAEIICAIRFLHNRHIIYRDLKLDNILLDSLGHIRLVDFGMCQCRTYREEMLPSNFCGTPEYISPEIIKGVPYNHSVDWWSFGVLLYEMAVGKMPFRGQDENELLWNVCYEQIHYPMFLSKELATLLQQLLEREPSKRMGMATCKAGDIQDQAFFRSVDWSAIEQLRVKPPFVPEVNSRRDVQNFDTDFTESACELSPVAESTLAKIDQAQFQKFPYTNPNIEIFDSYNNNNNKNQL